jgi:molybdate transport system substrate-binding protein
MLTRAIAAGLATACVLVFGAVAEAAEIRVLASNGIKAAMEDLKPKFEKASGDTLSIEFSTAATLRDRIDKGEAFDVAILTDDAVDALIKSGKLSPATRTELAAVGIGVGYRKGAAKPDVRTGTSLKQALLNAKSIAYTGNGASRPAIDKMIAGLGIGHQLESKSHLVGPGQAPGSVAKGESDLVLTLISEILPEPGVELAGPLPSDFQTYLGFSAATGAKSGKATAAQALIKFLNEPATASIYKAKGMEAR